MPDHGYDTMTRGRSDRDNMNRDYSSRYGDRSRYDRSDRGALFGTDGDRHDYRDRDDRGYGRRSHSGSWSSDRDRHSQERFGRSSGHDLIASDRVEGTAVYGRDGNKLGTIHNFMVEKRGGQVRYAVMKCSDGFLGMDERYYPLEWSELDYDTRLDGYRVNMSEDDLDHRRSFNSRGRPVREDSDQRSSW